MLTHYFTILILALTVPILANTESFLLAIPNDPVQQEYEIKPQTVHHNETTITPGSTKQLILSASHLYNPEYSFSNQRKKNPSNPLLTKEQIQYQERWIKVEDFKPGDSYNARVSWPATYPVSIDIEPHFFQCETSTSANEDQFEVFVLIKYYPQFYSNSNDRMLSDLEVPIHLHLVNLRYGVLPVDIEPIIGLVVALIVVGLPFSNFIYNFIRNAS